MSAHIESVNVVVEAVNSSMRGIDPIISVEQEVGL